MRKLYLPLAAVRFPQRCVNCGGSAETAASIECSRGIDLLVLRWRRWFRFEVPCCNRCRKCHRIFGILFKIAAPVVLLGGLIAAFSAERHIPEEYQPTWTLGWTAAFVAGAYFSRNWLQTVIDANWMGICGLRLYSDDALVRIRNDQFADETEHLRTAG